MTPVYDQIHNHLDREYKGLDRDKITYWLFHFKNGIDIDDCRGGRIEAQRSDDQGEAYDARSRLHQLLQRTVRGIILAPANKAPDLHGKSSLSSGPWRRKPCGSGS